MDLIPPTGVPEIVHPTAHDTDQVVSPVPPRCRVLRWPSGVRPINVSDVAGIPVTPIGDVRVSRVSVVGKSFNQECSQEYEKKCGHGTDQERPSSSHGSRRGTR